MMDLVEPDVLFVGLSRSEQMIVCIQAVRPPQRRRGNPGSCGAAGVRVFGVSGSDWCISCCPEQGQSLQLLCVSIVFPGLCPSQLLVQQPGWAQTSIILNPSPAITSERGYCHWWALFSSISCDYRSTAAEYLETKLANESFWRSRSSWWAGPQASRGSVWRFCWFLGCPVRGGLRGGSEGEAQRDTWGDVMKMDRTIVMWGQQFGGARWAMTAVTFITSITK